MIVLQDEISHRVQGLDTIFKYTVQPVTNSALTNHQCDNGTPNNKSIMATTVIRTDS